ncbi:hypothetical protein L1987_20802 [Smallanthus sonchifolius]|uniref:Uncharacterized protein n=1 Tax=Smallanthus sonchifolius TaxID=185202 RepID=A0ACB9ITD2_9ASTR|nr:hypothetical protein L1987_20802 [Smallanthus sonchifolius]
MTWRTGLWRTKSFRRSPKVTMSNRIVMSSGCVERPDEGNPNEGAVMRLFCWCCVDISWLASGATRICVQAFVRVPSLGPYKLVSEPSNVDHQIAFDHCDLAVYDYSHILNLTPIEITPTFYLVQEMDLASVPLTVVPPAAEDEQGIPAQEVILALPEPNAPSTTRVATRGGLNSSFYREGRNAFAVRSQPSRHSTGSGNGWLECDIRQFQVNSVNTNLVSSNIIHCKLSYLS